MTDPKDSVSLSMPREEREAFLAEPHVGVISIERPGRGPLSAPIWYAYEPGGELTLITDGDSRKGVLLEKTRRFSLCAQSEAPPYKYVTVEGPVVSIEPTDRERDTRPMAHRYLGQEFGDSYIQATHDEQSDARSILVRMRPEEWLTCDFSKQFATPPQP